MYPGAHDAGWLGAAECPGTVATGGERDSYADSNSRANSYSNTIPNPNANSRQWMLSSVERDRRLYRRHDSELEWHELHGRILDTQPESGDE
jgi:hypothetical protein